MRKVKEWIWKGTHIIVGVPTRTLTPEEYELYQELIEVSEAATEVTIYEAVFEEESD